MFGIRNREIAELKAKLGVQEMSLESIEDKLRVMADPNIATLRAIKGWCLEALRTDGYRPRVSTENALNNIVEVINKGE